MNRNVIIAIIIIIVIAIVGAFVLTQSGNNNAKIDTRINFLKDNATFKNGEQVEFELKDVNGNVLAGEQLNITFSGDENQTYTVVTDSNGKGSLLLENEPAGDYVVVVKYGGNDKYSDYEAQRAITIVEGTSDSASTDSTSSDSTSTASSASVQSSNQTSTASSDSSSNSNLHYDSEYNFYYDDNGIVRGGQSDGMSAKELRENYESGDSIDENGNLQ